MWAPWELRSLTWTWTWTGTGTGTVKLHLVVQRSSLMIQVY